MNTLRPLIYFSLFKYPLTKEEILEFHPTASNDILDTEINYLLKKGVIYKFQEFYSTINDVSLINRRIKGNKMAKAIMPKAHKMGTFIAKFPYVESVSLSGALSKGYYDNDGDIDFFIITKPNRLWIARTLLILYKKIFLLNSRKYFCVNYFISSDNLKIVERNRFTATEIVTLIPVSGEKKFLSFLQENAWTSEYFPNQSSLDFSEISKVKKSKIILLIERILNTSIGNNIDNFFRRVTLKKWLSKFNYLEKEDFEIAMKSTKNISKHHPQNFQKKVIDLLNKEYDVIKKEYNLELQHEHA